MGPDSRLIAAQSLGYVGIGLLQQESHQNGFRLAAWQTADRIENSLSLFSSHQAVHNPRRRVSYFREGVGSFMLTTGA